ncbi:MAG: 3-oxoacyl-[acyl-carrier-protein] synthase III C-terminal domain-containing protein [Asticcacaulis sp.]
MPPLVKAIFETAETTIDDIDYVLFHQANVFMLKPPAQEVRPAEDKMPVAMETYGNTSSASIPLTIAAKLHDAFDRKRELSSWASASAGRGAP